MDKAGLDEIRDYTARECLTDSEWAALLSLAYEAVAAQERIDGWKREFQKVQAKRDAYRERAEQAEARVAELTAALKAADRMAMAYAGEMAAKSAGLDIQGFPLLEAYQAFMALNWAAMEGQR